MDVAAPQSAKGHLSQYPVLNREHLPFQKAFNAGKLPTHFSSGGRRVEIALMNDRYLCNFHRKLLAADVELESLTEYLYQALQREKVRRRNLRRQQIGLDVQESV